MTMLNQQNLVQQAMANYQADNLVECELLCQKILQQDPREFSGNQLLGVIYARRGQLREATKYLKKAREARPASLPVIENLINVMGMMGNWNEVIKQLNELQALTPEDNNVPFRRAEIEDRLGRKEEALSSYRQALDGKTPLVRAALRCGQIYHERPDWQAASDHLMHAIRLIFYNDASVVLEIETYHQHLDWLGVIDDSALKALDDQNLLQLRTITDLLIHACYGLWHDQCQIGNQSQATELRQHCKEIAEFTTRLSTIRKQAKLPATLWVETMLAIDQEDLKLAKSYLDALSKETDSSTIEQIDLIYAKGLIAMLKQDYDQALTNFNAIIQLDPDHCDGLVGRGCALAKLGRLTAAAACFNHVLELLPDYKQAHLELAEINLLKGNYDAGFKARERRNAPEQFLTQMDIPAPEEEPKTYTLDKLADKKVLLFSENPVQDFFIFSRYFPAFGERPQSIRLFLQKQEESLRPLYEHYRNISGVELVEGKLPECDVWISLQSLPFVFSTPNKEQVPYPLPPKQIHLAAAEQRERLFDTLHNIEQQSEKPQAKPLTQDDDLELDFIDEEVDEIFWIGLAPLPASQATEERLSLGELAKLGRKFEKHGLKTAMVCLQSDLTKQEHKLLEKSEDILFFEDVFDDYQQLAAIVKNMKFMIGHDTLAMHIAGSMQKHAWVVLPAIPDWLWGLEEERTQWYPSFRLYRISEDWGLKPLYKEVGEDIDYELQEGIFHRFIDEGLDEEEAGDIEFIDIEDEEIN